jgi:hypothetical protein
MNFQNVATFAEKVDEARVVWSGELGFSCVHALRERGYFEPMSTVFISPLVARSSPLFTPPGARTPFFWVTPMEKRVRI